MKLTNEALKRFLCDCGYDNIRPENVIQRDAEAFDGASKRIELFISSPYGEQALGMVSEGAVERLNNRCKCGFEGGDK